MRTADALFSAIRDFWAGVREADACFREGSGVLVRDCLLTVRFDVSGVKDETVVDVDVVYGFGTVGRVSGIFALSARMLIASARFFVIMAIWACERGVVVGIGGGGGDVDI